MELDVSEALRYLGAGSSAPEALRRQAEEIAEALTAALRPRYTYRVCALERKGGAFALPAQRV